MTAGVNANQHSFVDMAAQYVEGIALVIQNISRGISLQAKMIEIRNVLENVATVDIHGCPVFKNVVVFESQVSIRNTPNILSGSAMYLGSNGIVGISSSSRRYKVIDRELESVDVENAYRIQVVLAKYRDGFLVEGDEAEGRYMPMLIAEDVEEHLPEAVIHRDGKTQDWNPRVLIPVMLQMIKDQKGALEKQNEEIKQLKEELEVQKEELKRMKHGVEKLEKLMIPEADRVPDSAFVSGTDNRGEEAMED